MCQQSVSLWGGVLDFKCVGDFVCGSAIPFCGYNLRIDPVCFRRSFVMLRVGDVQKNNRVNLLDLVLGHSFIYWYSFVQKVQEKQVDEPHRQVHRCLIFKYLYFSNLFYDIWSLYHKSSLHSSSSSSSAPP